MIDYTDETIFAFPKGEPRQVAKIKKASDLAKEERECRAKVDARDKRRCFFPSCRSAATEKHHIVARSVRGKTVWRTDDILSACNKHHKWFKAGLIRVEGNPDVAPVKVFLTTLGEKAGIRVPERKAA